MFNLACSCMPVKGISYFWVCQAEFLVDQQKLKNTRCIGWQQIDLQSHFGDYYLYHQPDIRDFPQDFTCPLDRHFCFSRNQRYQSRFHIRHCKHYGNLLIGNPLFKELVLCAFRGDRVMSAVDFFA